MEPNLIIDNTNTNTKTNIDKFNCPVPHCTSRLVKCPRGNAAHICSKHPNVASRLGLTSVNRRKAYYCDGCDSYSRQPHAVCHECDPKICFHSKDERDEHLKEDHMKYHTETHCKHDPDCRSLNGPRGCGFTHGDIPTFFTPAQMTSLPPTMCPCDRPDLESRCDDASCRLNHFWGRVRYLIILQAAKSKSAKSQQAEPVATDEDRSQQATPVASDEDKSQQAEPVATDEDKSQQAEPVATDEDKSQQAEPVASDEDVSQQAEPIVSDDEDRSQQATPVAIDEDMSQQTTPHLPPDVEELSSIESDSDSNASWEAASWEAASWEGDSCWFNTRGQSSI
jgi:hypothetical protein